MVTLTYPDQQFLSREETCFVRFLAILLITNSHLDNLYPVPQFGTGGAIGNALFFMLSGYGLAVSAQQKKPAFPSWFWRRITRIYPSVYLVTIIDFGLNRSWFPRGPGDYLMAFAWPTLFWFVGAIMIFYPLFFLALRRKDNMAFIAGITLLSGLYIGWYCSFADLSTYTIEGATYFKWVFYLLMMLFGGYLARSAIHIPRGGMRHFLYLCASLVGYLGVILAVKAGSGKIQGLIHVLTVPIVYLVLTLSRSTFVARNILGLKAGRFVVSLLAGLALEIYLLQYMVYSSSLVASLPFPANVAAFWGIVLLLSLMVASVAAVLRKWLRQEESQTVLTY